MTFDLTLKGYVIGRAIIPQGSSRHTKWSYRLLEEPYCRPEGVKAVLQGWTMEEILQLTGHCTLRHSLLNRVVELLD